MKATLIAPLTVALVALTACGSQPPPAAEISNEVVDAMDISDEAKACMHKVIDNFALTEDEKALKAGENLDEVSEKAADGNADAQTIIARFESDLSACNANG